MDHHHRRIESSSGQIKQAQATLPFMEALASQERVGSDEKDVQIDYELHHLALFVFDMPTISRSAVGVCVRFICPGHHARQGCPAAGLRPVPA